MDADGKHSDLPKTVAPASLWGKDAIHQFDVFDPDTGMRLSVKVTDLGEDVLTLHGVTRRTHHYEIADTLTDEFARNAGSTATCSSGQRLSAPTIRRSFRICGRTGQGLGYWSC
jgi:hypothetical protein